MSTLPEVLVTRVMIYSALKKWELMAVVGKKLVEWNPDEPGFAIDWATRQGGRNQFTRPMRS